VQPGVHCNFSIAHFLMESADGAKYYHVAQCCLLARTERKACTRIERGAMIRAIPDRAERWANGAPPGLRPYAPRRQPRRGEGGAPPAHGEHHHHARQLLRFGAMEIHFGVASKRLASGPAHARPPCSDCGCVLSRPGAVPYAVLS
jgi:hypothetical protein